MFTGENDEQKRERRRHMKQVARRQAELRDAAVGSESPESFVFPDLTEEDLLNITGGKFTPQQPDKNGLYRIVGTDGRVYHVPPGVAVEV